MLIGKFSTIPIQDDAGRYGYFEFDLVEDEKLIDRQPEPRAYVLRLIAQTAAGLSEAEEMPIDFFQFCPSPRCMTLTGLPEAISFNPDDHTARLIL